MSALWTASPGDDVKKLNLYETYALGKRLACIADIEEDALTSTCAFDLWFARNELETYIDSAQLMPSSNRAAAKLISAINDVVPREPEKISAIDENAKINWRASMLRNAVTELESVMRNEMPDVSAYVVSQKGIFRTDDLIQRAEYQLSVASRAKLPDSAKFDIQQAGKCLAYELAVATSFHLWRAVETVMELLYENVTGHNFSSAGSSQNWGAYIKLMESAGIDSKITAFLDHIRERYRNPTAHPDMIIEIEEAQGLFQVALSSIDQMMIAIPKPATGSSPISALLGLRRP